MSSTKQKLIAVAFLLLFAVSAQAEEISLFDQHGVAVAYVVDDLTVYIWDGDPVAYLSGADRHFSIYAFNGMHLGWFINGIVYDHGGNSVGFVKGAAPDLTTSLLNPDET